MRVLLYSFLMPPTALAIITAVRVRSKSFLSYPASSSAMLAVSKARCWIESICLATEGGILYFKELNLKPVIKPPILL